MSTRRRTTKKVEEDTKSPDAEAVKEYLESGKTGMPDGIDALLAGEEEVKTPVQEELKPDDDGVVRISLKSDTTYTEEERTKPIEDMFVPVQDHLVAVTPEDQALYLKATLNSEPVILPVKMENGIKMECRSLSLYEGDLALEATRLYFCY